MNKKVQDVVRLSLISALYVVMTIINPFSYDAVQFRISEILMFLVFFKKDYSISLIIGCFISNLFSDIMIYDIIFGTAATALSCLCMTKTKNIYICAIFPVIFNAIIVGFELFLAFNTPFLINALWVFIGEAVVMIIGLLIFIKLRNNAHFLELIKANLDN